MENEKKMSTLLHPARIAAPLLFSLLLGGCSYHDGKFSYFDFDDEAAQTQLTARQATEKFWAAVRPRSNLADAHYRLGLHYQQTRELDKAIAEFGKALRLDPGYCKAYNGIAMTNDLRKRCDAAHAAYEQAVRCAPGEAYVYNNYACSSLLCGDFGKGMELLHRAESLAAGNTRIQNNLQIARTVAVHDSISTFLNEAAQPSTAARPEPGERQESPVLQNLADTIEPPRSASLPSEPRKEEPSASQPAALAGSKAEPTNQKESSQAQPDFNTDNIAVTVSTPPLPSAGPVGVEVSNGNGATGMAKRSAAFLRGCGFMVRSITNADHFHYQESVIYYKQGYLHSAKELAALLPGARKVEQVESLTKTSVGLRVVLGLDLARMHFPQANVGLVDRSPKQSGAAVLTASYQPAGE